jgi:AraC-like DNA-binding protein
MDGRVRITESRDTHELVSGESITVGAKRCLSITPLPAVRMWTLCVDENFLRVHLGRVLTDPDRVHAWLKRDSWDGSAIVWRPGSALQRRFEPIWRQMGAINTQEIPEVQAARLITLFSHTVEIALPSLMMHPIRQFNSAGTRRNAPVLGAVSGPRTSKPVRQAMDILRSHMAESWTVQRLSREVATSTSHLTRLFTTQVGVPPMRFLAEVRLTEFTRLIEETELSISTASQSVGWKDGRVAAAQFRRRFGVSPSDFRTKKPHSQPA